MSRGVLAIFSNIETSSYETLRAFTSHHEIPFVTMTHPIHEYTYASDNDNDNESDRSVIDPTLPSFGPESSDDGSFIQHSSVWQDDERKDARHDSNGARTMGGATSQIGSSHANHANKESFLLNMHPDMVPLLVSMIKYNRWRNIYYVYDYDEALNRLEGLFEFQIKDTDFHTNIHVRKLDDVSNVASMRKTLKPISQLKDGGDGGAGGGSGGSGVYDPYKRNQKNEITVFLDLSSTENYAQFLQQVKNMGMNTPKYHYFLITLVIIIIF